MSVPIAVMYEGSTVIPVLNLTGLNEGVSRGGGAFDFCQTYLVASSLFLCIFADFCFLLTIFT